MKLIVGTRGSRLSLIQTDEVIRKILRFNSDVQIERRIIETSGDRNRERPLFMFRMKGIFERQVDRALLKSDIDFAVHSFKDVPTDISRRIVIVAVPKRSLPNDVLISKDRVRLRELPRGAKIGTSSMRRMVQLRRLRSDLIVNPIRGNVETRVRKVGDSFDGVIVAEAGVRRLGLDGAVSERLSIDDFMPAAGQGALAVVARRDSKAIREVLAPVDDYQSRAQVYAESEFTRKLEGGCRSPICAIAKTSGKKIVFRGSLYSPDARRRLDVSAEGSIDDAVRIGSKAAREVSRLGGKSLINEWRKVWA